MPELVKSTELKVKSKDKSTTLTLSKKESPKLGEYWRLIYNSATNEVVMLFKAEGTTLTALDMFCGTHEECLKEIETLGLTSDKIKSEKLKLDKPMETVIETVEVKEKKK